RIWSPELRDVVLAHEIAHLTEQDPLRHLLARCALAVYWFHPLAWIAARQAAAAREQACDEAVLSLGTRRSEYARVLLELAESMRSPSAVAALPMVQRSLLENRVMTILHGDRPSSSSRRMLWPAMVIVAVTGGAAVAQPTAAMPQPAAPIAHEASAAASPGSSEIGHSIWPRVVSDASVAAATGPL